jgi:hypothetical protein
LLNARRREAEKIGIDPDPRDVTPDLQAFIQKHDAAKDGEE